MSELEALFTKYGTDKGIWGYTPAYEHHLEDRRPIIRAVLEIGICGHRDIPNNVIGASLFAWRDYFPNALIYGIDNDSKWIFNDQKRIHTDLCDAYDREALQRTIAIAEPMPGKGFDFICDDAVHDPLNQMFLVRELWRYLAPGGVYAIEEACPYKVPNGNLFEHMIAPLMREHEDMVGAVEYRTHKDERLVVLTKR
jgi:SAM-dependent methyltransferase